MSGTNFRINYKKLDYYKLLHGLIKQISERIIIKHSFIEGDRLTVIRDELLKNNDLSSVYYSAKRTLEHYSEDVTEIEEKMRQLEDDRESLRAELKSLTRELLLEYLTEELFHNLRPDSYY